MKKLNFAILFLIFSLVVSSVAGGTIVNAETPLGKMHSMLLKAAKQSPNEWVEVIVQKNTTEQTPEAHVAKLGGTVTQDLSIIRGFAARLPAQAAISLSKLPEVRWISPDAAVNKSADPPEPISNTNLLNTYIREIGADRLWARGIQGQGIRVAVIDSGVNPQNDLYTMMGRNRLIESVAFNDDANYTSYDGFGHGNLMAGIIAGNGAFSLQRYVGVAPMAEIVNVKVSNDDGSARVSNVIAGMQWVLNNKNRLNIRVANLSLNTNVAESYHTSPLAAAAEILWFNKIVVVASSGNKQDGRLYAPANDPFIITVGAVDDKGTIATTDDTLTNFSGYGLADGFSKPDLVAPGRNIVSLNGLNTIFAGKYPERRVESAYFRASGTSMSAAMVAGAVALLLQDEPTLTPDQVKYRLMATANKGISGYSSVKAGAGLLNIQAAVDGTTTESANTGQPVSRLISGSNSTTYNSVSWNSVSWNSVSWNSVSWNSVSWNSVSWNSTYWGN
ncbi:MAG: S8 family peptidase [Anaerolineae bacterium]|nr:S8 family peptidase [Anaerolineae bacterium]